MSVELLRKESGRTSLERDVRNFVLDIVKNADDISFRQLAILILAQEQVPPPTVKQVSDMLNVPKPSISRVLDTLSIYGLVRRRKDPRDKRIVSVHLTPGGEKMLGDIFKSLYKK